MNEAQLQAKCVKWFSETFPEMRGQLWSTQNNTYSKSHGANQQALGMVRGVADLMFLNEGTLFGIELKVPGTRHDVAHIFEQYQWGKMIMKQGHVYNIVTSFEGFAALIYQELHQDRWHLLEIEELLNTDKKTVKFDEKPLARFQGSQWV